MDDAVDAGDDVFHRGEIGEVGDDEVLVGGKVVRFADVAPADARIEALHQLAQSRAYAARRSGHRESFASLSLVNAGGSSG